MSWDQIYFRTNQMFLGKRQLTALALFLLLPVLWVGCGDGDESDPALTKAQFVSQAQALCEKEAKKTEQEVEDFSTEKNLRYRKNPPAEVYEEAAEEIFVPSVERQLEGLQELGTPAGDEQALEKIYAAAEEGLKEGEANPASLISGQALGEVRALASKYGIDPCFQ